MPCTKVSSVFDDVGFSHALTSKKVTKNERAKKHSGAQCVSIHVLKMLD